MSWSIDLGAFGFGSFDLGSGALGALAPGSVALTSVALRSISRGSVAFGLLTFGSFALRSLSLGSIASDCSLSIQLLSEHLTSNQLLSDPFPVAQLSLGCSLSDHFSEQLSSDRLNSDQLGSATLLLLRLTCALSAKGVSAEFPGRRKRGSGVGETGGRRRLFWPEGSFSIFPQGLLVRKFAHPFQQLQHRC